MEKSRGMLKKLSGDSNISTSILTEILNHSNVSQYDQGIYFIQQTLHIIRVVISPMKIPTSMTIGWVGQLMKLADKVQDPKLKYNFVKISLSFSNILPRTPQHVNLFKRIVVFLDVLVRGF